MKNEDKIKIIVSLTSYPDRIQWVHKVIKTLLIQTFKPDKIIIWLSKEEFPKGKEELPHELTELCKYGLSICWVEGNLGPHKKYFYAMQQYYNDIIITVDDDMYYSPELVEKLYDSYIRHPNAVSCVRTNLICRDGYGKIQPYDAWEKSYSYCEDAETADLLAVGCGGVLYPPQCFDIGILCNESDIVNYCLYQDDIWLKINELIKGIPVVQIKNSKKVIAETIQKAQKTALCENVNVNGNDAALIKLDGYLSVNSLGSLIELIFENANMCTVERLQTNKKTKIDNIIKKSIDKGVYIFGAGEGAKSTFECLRLNKTEKMISGFVVTHIDKNPTTLFGLPVIPISEMKAYECLMIISTADKLQREIICNLKKKGFKNLLSVNNTLIGEYNYSQRKRREVEINFLTLCTIE